MIQLQISTVVVYFSTNYADFRMINGNRELNEKKIKRIRQDIMAGIDVLKYCPILVANNGQTLEIIDGQHRFWVAKELKRPVHFIIVDKTMDLYSIASVNSNTEKWKYTDYLKSYIQLNNQHYITLRDFMETYNFGHKTAISLLMNGNATGAWEQGKLFERGRFKVQHKAKAIEIADQVMKFKDFPYHNSREFVQSICKILEAGKCDFDDLVDKFKQCPENLSRQATYKEYLNNLETVYNYRMRSRRYLC